MGSPFGIPRPRRLLKCWEWAAGWIEKLTPVFVLVGVLILAGLVIEVLHQQRQIAEQRRDTIRVSCEETNLRNRNTIREYDTRIAEVAPRLTAAQRAQLKQTRAFTVGLIDALAPVEDCRARVRRLSAAHPKRQHR